MSENIILNNIGTDSTSYYAGSDYLFTPIGKADDQDTMLRALEEKGLSKLPMGMDMVSAVNDNIQLIYHLKSESGKGVLIGYLKDGTYGFLLSLSLDNLVRNYYAHHVTHALKADEDLAEKVEISKGQAEDIVAVRIAEQEQQALEVDEDSTDLTDSESEPVVEKSTDEESNFKIVAEDYKQDDIEDEAGFSSKQVPLVAEEVPGQTEEEPVEEEPVEEEPVEEDTVEEDTVEEDTVEEDTVEEDTVEEDTVEEEPVEKSNDFDVNSLINKLEGADKHFDGTEVIDSPTVVDSDSSISEEQKHGQSSQDTTVVVEESVQRQEATASIEQENSQNNHDEGTGKVTAIQESSQNVGQSVEFSSSAVAEANRNAAMSTDKVEALISKLESPDLLFGVSNPEEVLKQQVHQNEEAAIQPVVEGKQADTQIPVSENNPVSSPNSENSGVQSSEGRYIESSKNDIVTSSDPTYGQSPSTAGGLDGFSHDNQTDNHYPTPTSDENAFRDGLSEPITTAIDNFQDPHALQYNELSSAEMDMLQAYPKLAWTDEVRQNQGIPRPGVPNSNIYFHTPRSFTTGWHIFYEHLKFDREIQTEAQPIELCDNLKAFELPKFNRKYANSFFDEIQIDGEVVVNREHGYSNRINQVFEIQSLEKKTLIKIAITYPNRKIGQFSEKAFAVYESETTEDGLINKDYLNTMVCYKIWNEILYKYEWFTADNGYPPPNPYELYRFFYNLDRSRTENSN